MIKMHEDYICDEVLLRLFRTNRDDATRIITREGDTVEFKQSFGYKSMPMYFKTIAAFANNKGGYIIFGVSDSPRRLVGLKDKALEIFEDLKVEHFTNDLHEYFSPEIKWEHRTFEFNSMKFGVIYVHSLLHKPCICKKDYDDKESKYTLHIGDIYYRYRGRTEKIRYEELAAIINTERENEKKQWINLVSKIAKIGPSNVSLLDWNTGSLSDKGGTVVISESLLEQIAFIKEGHFVENGGTPTLRLIGNVEPGKIIEIGKGKTKYKHVPRTLNPCDLEQAFLRKDKVEEPFEFVKCACSANSQYYPIYYFLWLGKISITEAISRIKSLRYKTQGKIGILERLQGKRIVSKKYPNPMTNAGIKKEEYREKWLQKVNLDNIADDDIRYCFEAFLSLSDEEIIQNEKYLREIMFKVYSNIVVNIKKTDATTLRKAICRMDEVLYLNKAQETSFGR